MYIQQGMDALSRLKDKTPFTLTVSVEAPHPPFVIPSPYYGSPYLLIAYCTIVLQRHPFHGLFLLHTCGSICACHVICHASLVDICACIHAYAQIHRPSS